MKITRSARRHGISETAIRHAVANAIRFGRHRRPTLVIGSDASRRLLELVARPIEAGGDLVVFHAMPLRPANAKRYLP